MRGFLLAATCLILAAGALGACGEQATQSVAAGSGPAPTLPPPHPTLIPTVNVAPALGWPEGAMPLPIYLRLHPEAVLSDADKSKLLNWIADERARMASAGN